MKRDSRQEFYVNYLPTPPGLREFLWRVPAVAGVIFVGVAVLAARSMTTPGGGSWESDRAVRISGTVLAEPYPMILTEDRGDGVPGAMLLVEVGKYGGGQRAAALDGHAARVSGWRVHRDGRFILEMEPGVAIEDLGPVAPRRSEWRSLGTHVLLGEIVDTKCYLGAMRPGEGITHKQCATLCIAGGIPPTLVTRDRRGQAMYYLVTDAEGRAMTEPILDLVGEPVEARGEVVTRDGLVMIRVASVRRSP